jgi:hypothetical protein
MRLVEHAGPVLQRGRWRIGLAAVLGLTLAVHPDAASVKVKVAFDKAFDFRQMHTWGWNPNGAGQVILARTQGEDPDVVRQRAEPVIMEVLSAEMRRVNLAAASGPPDLTVTYYLLVTVGASAQTMGQFLPSVAMWGLPPFAPQTTALQAIEQGSLVLDLASKGTVVWRGAGEAGFGLDLDQAKRAALLREAVRKLMEKYPKAK